jgi:hypothetical protein
MPKDSAEANHLYLTALLNSRLLDWIYRVRYEAISVRGGYVEYRENLSNLPIYSTHTANFDSDWESAVSKAKEQYQSYVSPSNTSTISDFRWPEQSDVVYDLLAYLAEEMIRLNREKRIEQSRYLAGLVAESHISPDKDGNTGLDALVGKSKLADYPGDYQKQESHLTFDDLADILRKNRSRLGANLNDTALLARLAQEYAASLAVALPLKERLARTDRLIDQIVYRLYGLTEDEIAIVEGR